MILNTDLCVCSTNEIEDVLSCDDTVLKDVLQYHVPPQRRLPPLLWLRIQVRIKRCH